MARWSLRTIVPLAAVGCAGLLASKAMGQRRTPDRPPPVSDPPDRHLAEEDMEALATGEGMPEAGAE